MIIWRCYFYNVRFKKLHFFGWTRDIYMYVLGRTSLMIFFSQFLIIVNIVTSLGLITCETFWPGGRFSTGDDILHHQVFSARVLQPMKQQLWCVVDLSHDICVILIKHSLRQLIVRVLTQHYICLHSMCLAVQQLYNACVSKKANLQQG